MEKETGTTEFDSSDYNNQNFLKNSCSPYDEEELEALRLKRQKEVKIRKILREIFFYSIFLWMLYIVAFLNNDSNLSNYKSSVQTYFSSIPGINQSITFDSITVPNDVIDWLKGFSLSLYAYTYYNQAPNMETYLIKDFASMLVGYPILRQHRVVNSKLRYLFYYCIYYVIWKFEKFFKNLKL